MRGCSTKKESPLHLTKPLRELMQDARLGEKAIFLCTQILHGTFDLGADVRQGLTDCRVVGNAFYGCYTPYHHRRAANDIRQIVRQQRLSFGRRAIQTVAQ